MTSEKKPIRIGIEDLLINPKNPRFDPVQNQRQAIDTMVREMKDKIKNLANDIAKNGLNPTKFLCVVKHLQGKYRVLEGNRRLMAIKLINSPHEIKMMMIFKNSFKS